MVAQMVGFRWDAITYPCPYINGGLIFICKGVPAVVSGYAMDFTFRV